jgi:DNA-binding NtrC family response regulator
MSTLSHSSRLGRTATRPKSVLLVDCTQEEGENLARLLRMIYGPLVLIRHVETGRQALDALRRMAFDLVLIDYRLAGADGLELLSDVLDCVDQTAVLLMTAQANDRLAAEALRRGAADYFVKNDLGPAELEQLITQALRTVRLEHRHRQAIVQWRMDQTERSDRVRALSDDMSIRLSRLDRWMRNASQGKSDATPSGENLRQIGNELRELQRLVAELSTLAQGSQDAASCRAVVAQH